MAANATANPNTRVITITKTPDAFGVVEISVVDDIYEGMKEDWHSISSLQGMRFPFSSFGDFKTPTQQIGPYISFDNGSGWRLEPYDADHTLIVLGNFIPSDVTKPVWISRAGRTIVIRSEQSNQALTVNTDNPTIQTLRKLQQNEMIVDPVAGTITILDDDDATPLLTAPIFEDVAEAIPYRGQGVAVRKRMT